MKIVISPEIKITLYFWHTGKLVVVPKGKQTSAQLSRQYYNVPCMKHNENASPRFDFGRFNYQGWKRSNSKIPKQLKAMQLLLT